MYERSRQFILSNVAGFSHWDGPFVASKLKPGTKLRLVSEPDNPYDPNAVAVYYKKTKIGFVPRRLNSEIAQILYFGHAEVFQARVAAVNPNVDLEHQVTMEIRVRDIRA